MRLWSPLAAVLVACLSVPGIAPAAAQVSVDLHALDKLPQNPPTKPPAGGDAVAAPSAAGATAGKSASLHHGHPNQRSAHATHRGTAGQSAAHADSHGKGAAPTARAAPAAPATATAPPPAATLPTAAPPPVVLAPVPPPPEAHAAPAPPPVAADAGGDALAIVDGMRVTFQPSRFDLSPETADALKRFAAMVPHSDDVTLDVRAFAAAMADDPSAARRLSLSRSLAIRAALMAEGFPSNRIFLRALGARGGDGPADRCDILISRLGAPPPAPVAAPPPAPVAGAPPPAAAAGSAPPPASASTAAAEAPRPPAGAASAPIARP